LNRVGAAPSARTVVRRHPERGRYDKATVDEVLREGFVCHVAFAVDGAPVVLPTTYAPWEDGIIVHGGATSRMFTTLASGAPACVAVTLLDGLVLARSATHHSMNYRSVVVFASGVDVVDRGRKREALAALVEHVVPGRGAFIRPPMNAELDITRVVWFAVDEASAKVRAGPPVDADADLDLPVWAGVIPLRAVAGPAESDALSAGKFDVPAHVATWSR
jgi:nitroimidazol reductase NimA-like FMN-containing flavoprotein (pyridoxamine 5'-phosphate oxidase superfamily)